MNLDEYQGLPGVPEKVLKFKIFVLRTHKSLNFVSFVRHPG